MFLVNALLPKPMNIDASIFEVHRSYDVEDTEQRFVFLT